MFRDKIKPHLLLYAPLRFVRFILNPYRGRHISAIKHMSEIDSISDFPEFKQKIERIKANKSVTMLRINRYGDESRMGYGYYQEIMKYAGLSEKGFIYIPSMEHGIRFSGAPWKERSGVISSICFACQGPGRLSDIYDLDPWKPIFVLGPYIHYAAPYYSAEETEKLKNELGRVLLVFPSHSYEYEEAADGQDLYSIIYKKYASDYDTIMVCIYWNDTDNPVLDLYAKRGAKIVSAGYRNDPNFIRRLKTIISLADDVVVDDLGTNIGFCKYMGKTVYFESAVPRLPEDKVLVENHHRFYEAFYSPNKEFTESQLRLQNELYDHFWGGDKYLRTSEEIRDIISVLKEMCRATLYNINRMPKFIQAHCSGNVTDGRYKLLAEAVSPSVWKGQ